MRLKNEREKAGKLGGSNLCSVSGALKETLLRGQATVSCSDVQAINAVSSVMYFLFQLCIFSIDFKWLETLP